MLRLILCVQIENGLAGGQAVIGHKGLKVADMVWADRIEFQSDSFH
jgi:hypothetical protein